MMYRGVVLLFHVAVQARAVQACGTGTHGTAQAGQSSDIPLAQQRLRNSGCQAWPGRLVPSWRVSRASNAAQLVLQAGCTLITGLP